MNLKLFVFLKRISKENTKSNYFKYKYAIFMMLFSGLSGSFMRLFIKSIHNIPEVELLIFQYLPILLFAPIFIKKRKYVLFGKNKKVLFYRGFYGFFGGIFYIYAIQNLLLADSAAISQLVPFFVILFSWYLLKEKLSINRVLILLFAFFGAMFIIRPSYNYVQFSALIGLLATAFTGLAHTFVRALRKTEPPIVIVNYHAYFSSVVSIFVLLITKTFVLPEIKQIIPLIFMGIFTFLTQIGFTYAYKLGPAKIVAPFSYFQIGFSIILGFIFFSEIPNIYSIFGMIIIVLSGLLNVSTLPQEISLNQAKDSHL
ncbi:MAG: DMT family transporter [Eubacteriaceae bacterium]